MMGNFSSYLMYSQLGTHKLFGFASGSQVFKGMRELKNRKRKGSPKTPPTNNSIPSFPSGYPLAGCSSAEPASVSPDLFTCDKQE
jgi:hypothetical protein